MQKRSKTIVVVLIVLIVLIQFIRPARNQSEQTYTQSLVALYHTPDNVRQILQTSCGDCHSNNTHYPWYVNVQPVGWWLANHISEGKRELNLDEFGTYTDIRQLHKLRSIKHEIQDDKMPLTSYTLIHRNARLSDVQKAQLLGWVNQALDSLNR